MRRASNQNHASRTARPVLHRATVVGEAASADNWAELLRRVAQGESVMVTNNGVPAAVIVPRTAGVRERLAASVGSSWAPGLGVTALPPPTTPALPTQDVLDEDRGS